MSISVRSEWWPDVAVRVYTAHVRCGLCDAEVTASVGGERGAQLTRQGARTMGVSRG